MADRGAGQVGLARLGTLGPWGPKFQKLRIWGVNVSCMGRENSEKFWISSIVILDTVFPPENFKNLDPVILPPKVFDVMGRRFGYLGRLATTKSWFCEQIDYTVPSLVGALCNVT